MIPNFEDALDVTPLDDGQNWRVTSPFYYDTDVALTPSAPARAISCIYPNPGGGWRIVVRPGFETDFASVPRILWALLPPTGRYSRGAVVHDLLYRTPGLCTRRQADAVIYEAMKYPCRVPFCTRWTIWLGLRLAGSFAWRADQQAATT